MGCKRTGSAVSEEEETLKIYVLLGSSQLLFFSFRGLFNYRNVDS